MVATLLTKVLLTTVLMLASAATLFGNKDSDVIHFNVREVSKPLEHNVTITVYNPVPEQCDSDPLTTASGYHINIDKLKRGEIHICAISRDLMCNYSFGDTIFVDTQGKSHLEGLYVIQDLMNKRHTNSIDLLTYDTKSGKWQGTISKK